MRAGLTMPTRLAGRAIARAVASQLAHLPDDTSAVLLHRLLLHYPSCAALPCVCPAGNQVSQEGQGK